MECPIFQPACIRQGNLMNPSNSKLERNYRKHNAVHNNEMLSSQSCKLHIQYRSRLQYSAVLLESEQAWLIVELDQEIPTKKLKPTSQYEMLASERTKQ